MLPGLYAMLKGLFIILQCPYATLSGLCVERSTFTVVRSIYCVTMSIYHTVWSMCCKVYMHCCKVYLFCYNVYMPCCMVCAVLYRSSGRVRGPAVDAQKHREKLARLILESQPQVDSGYEDDKDLEKDDAVELLGMHIAHSSCQTVTLIVVQYRPRTLKLYSYKCSPSIPFQFA